MNRLLEELEFETRDVLGSLKHPLVRRTQRVPAMIGGYHSNDSN
jgi:hypothetical protein